MTPDTCIFCHAIAKHELTVERIGASAMEARIVIHNNQGVRAVIPDRWDAPADPAQENLLERAISILTDYTISEDFLDWCDDFDIDPAQSAELDHYKAIGSGLADLQAMIGDRDVSGLIGGLQIAQALGNAMPR